MTIEEAIMILDPETRRESLREIPVLERIDTDQEACRIAVAALRAQQEDDTSVCAATGVPCCHCQPGPCGETGKEATHD